MEPYFLDSDFTVYIHRLGAEAEEIISPFGGREYACLVALGTTALPEEARRHLASELVRTNCRYAVLLGSDYDPLLIDLLNANREDPRYEDPNEGILMTHWYESSEIEEAAYALFALCNHGDSYYEEFLVLFSNTDRETSAAIMKCIPEQINEGRGLRSATKWARSIIEQRKCSSPEPGTN